MNRKSIFWGVFLILAAVVLIAGQFVSGFSIGIWRGIGLVLTVAVLIKSCKHRFITGVTLSAALLYILLRSPLGLPAISPWLLLLAGLLCGIGLTLLIRPKWRSTPRQHMITAGGHQAGQSETGDVEYHFEHERGYRPENRRIENSDEDHPSASVSFGAVSKYLHSSNLESGCFHLNFGALDVFFDQVQLSEKGAEIEVECSFGAVRLYVPRQWTVWDDVSTTLAGMNNEARAEPGQEDGPTLYLKGSVTLGAVDVIYV
ncbi:hypothetical protein LJC49_03290 [Ruminococcaceae bacterium OttesenSCG-928-I18]|nr:hypothetical protein [Ruminococcaceae bacterium OttesenSCG-928-I18]